MGSRKDLSAEGAKAHHPLTSCAVTGLLALCRFLRSRLSVQIGVGHDSDRTTGYRPRPRPRPRPLPLPRPQPRPRCQPRPRPRHCASAVDMVETIMPPVTTTVPSEYMPSRMLVATTRDTKLRMVLPTLLSAIVNLPGPVVLRASVGPLPSRPSGLRRVRCASLLMLSEQ
jgi:hypothetical protein